MISIQKTKFPDLSYTFWSGERFLGSCPVDCAVAEDMCNKYRESQNVRVNVVYKGVVLRSECLEQNG